MTTNQIKVKISNLNGQYEACTLNCPLKIKVSLVTEIRKLQSLLNK